MHSAALLQLFQQQEAGGRQQRLCAALRQAINQGRLSLGQKLPSSRLLAQQTGLSRVTVESAYARLESEGYLQRQTGRGTFVAIAIARPQKNPSPGRLPRFSARGQAILATGGCRDPLYPQAFAAGAPELRAFPHQIWRRLSASIQRQQGAQLMHYGDPAGLPALREAIADYLRLARGINCAPEQVLVMTSSQQALQLLAWMFLDAGDTAWLENPCYPGARNAFISAGAHCQPLALDQEGALPASGAPRLVYLTPSHQYPTGVSMSLARRLSWLALAQREQCWLIEDDYDSEFLYDQRPQPAMQGLDSHSRVISLGTFSKTLFPSLRLAWIVVPPGLTTAFATARSLMDGHGAQLPQAVTAAFIAQGHFAAHLRLMRQLYHSRRDFLLAQIRQKLDDWLSPLPGPGGLQLAVLLRAGDEAQLTRLAAQRGLVLPRLSPLCQGSDQYTGWLLGFSALERSEIAAACDKLREVLIMHAGRDH